VVWGEIAMVCMMVEFGGGDRLPYVAACYIG
jgi:hypothetical protein